MPSWPPLSCSEATARHMLIGVSPAELNVVQGMSLIKQGHRQGPILTQVVRKVMQFW